jgi:sensor c-di-GMP phosphodiesterase-like protein
MLKLCCVMSAFAAVVIVVAAVLAEIVDSGHVTMAGRIGAISAGLLFATLAVGFVASFYRKRMLKATSELQQARNAGTGQFQSSG